VENTTLRDIEAQGPGSVLEEIARRGAQQMLAQAMEAEVALFIENHADKVDENGHRKVVRNGHMPARELVTGIGRVPIKQPRVDDRQLV
jgi:putative transposase